MIFLKPSRFVAFLALFSILFISPVPSNAAGVHMPMNDKDADTVMMSGSLAETKDSETTCFGRLLCVLKTPCYAGGSD